MKDERDRQIEASVNHTVVNKVPAGADKEVWKKYNSSWKCGKMTARELAIDVWHGYGFCAVFKENRRKKVNFLRAWHVGLDFDCGDERAQIKTLLEDDFINWFSSFIYYTPSSHAPAYKSRVVFILDQPIESLDRYELLLSAFAWRFPNSDQGVAEGARLFFGSKDCELHANWSILPVTSANVLIEEYQRSRPPETEPRPIAVVGSRKQVSANFLTSHAERLLDNIRQAGDGEKYVTLRDISRTFGGYVAGGYYETVEVSDWLKQAVRKHTLDNETHADNTIDQGIAYGQLSPLHFENTYMVEDVR